MNYVCAYVEGKTLKGHIFSCMKENKYMLFFFKGSNVESRLGALELGAIVDYSVEHPCSSPPFLYLHRIP